MLDVILVSNFSMKDELSELLNSNDFDFYDCLIQDIQHIERYPIDDEYKTIIIQSANAIKKIDSSNNHIYNTERVYGIGPNCKNWVEKKFGIKCLIPDEEYSSTGLIKKIESDMYSLGKTLLLKGIGGRETIINYLKEKDIKFNVCDVYERILNLDNLAKVAEMTSKECIIIAFSKSSIEPLISEKKADLKKIHFFILDKSDEQILNRNDVASITMIDDIYDIKTLANKIREING
ncbi:MAG: uroporphyrinogen-III synthase [Gammaproteobacteria bacterium]|jgi:uroporphyrinogen-III synthase|nr:uroporphyrinogen-III synthase [Gammaproteobacteria bacterium]